MLVRNARRIAGHPITRTGQQFRRAVASAAAAPPTPAPSQTDLDIPHATLVEMLIDQCRKIPQNPLFGTKVGNNFNWITYGDFGREVGKLRTVFKRLGLGRNDKVALISNNRVEWAVTCYAINSLCGQIVPMYEAQAESDRRFIVEDSEAEVIVVATESLYQQTKEYVNKVGRVKHVICLDSTPDKPYSYRRLLDEVRSDSEAVAPLMPHSDDIATIIYTSGTSGKPKGVELSHHNILSNLAGMKVLWQSEMDKKKEREVLCFLPWSHVFGQTVELHGVLNMGERMAIAPNRDELLASTEILKPTQMAAVPILMNKIYDGVQKKLSEVSPTKQRIVKWAFSVCRERNNRLEYGRPVSAFLNFKFLMIDKIVMSKIRSKIIGGRLEFLGSGAAALPMNVLHFFEDIGIPICEGYGLTETSPVVSSGTPDWTTRRLGCVGVPIRGVTVQIRRLEEGSTEFLPSDTDGEVCVAGPNVMKGYRNNPNANAEVFFTGKDGLKYFKTVSGDVGRIVEGKFLKITGRIKEQYKLENGKYVVPAPIEDMLARSIVIHQAFIYGDNRNFSIALIVPNIPELRDWVKKKNLAVSETAPLDELLSLTDVQKLISMEILVTTSGLKEYEIPRRWAPVPEFTLENHMMTPKMSFRRNNILSEHLRLIEKVYAREAGVDVSSGGISQRKWNDSIASSME